MWARNGQCGLGGALRACCGLVWARNGQRGLGGGMLWSGVGKEWTEWFGKSSAVAWCRQGMHSVVWEEQCSGLVWARDGQRGLGGAMLWPGVGKGWTAVA